MSEGRFSDLLFCCVDKKYNLEHHYDELYKHGLLAGRDATFNEGPFDDIEHIRSTHHMGKIVKAFQNVMNLENSGVDHDKNRN